MTAKFHTCSLICMFVQVHAPAKHDFHFIRRHCGEIVAAVSGFTTLRLLYALWVLRCFFDTLKGPDGFLSGP